MSPRGLMSNWLRTVLFLAGAAAAMLLAAAAPVGAQLAFVPLGPEFRVNTYTTAFQASPAVSSDADGDFVVVWDSIGDPNTSTLDIFGQRYDSSGAALGVEFQVNTYTTSAQIRSSVSSEANGGFVVVWEDDGQDGSGYGVFGQRYESGGAALGGEFRVNTYTTSRQYHPVLGSDTDGDFVVVWASAGQDGSGDGIFGQRYNSSGAALGVEFRVNTYTTSSQTWPSVSSDADGDFVVVWASNGQDGSGDGIFGQRYSSSGVALGVEFRVNAYTTSGQLYPSVSSEANGDFVVTWSSDGQDGSVYGIFARRYASSGVALGGEFQVNIYTTSSQLVSFVSSDADGDFFVTWISNGQDGSDLGVFGRRYDSNGVALGGELQVNTYTNSLQHLPAVSSDADGDIVVTWMSDGQDGSGVGIYGQRFGLALVTPTPTPTLTPTPTPTHTPSGPPPQLIGSEFQVNTYTIGGQAGPSVASDSTGAFVVVWNSEYQDGQYTGVFGQHFDALGAPNGFEFRVNSTTSGSEQQPSVGMAGDGRYVAAWETFGQDGSSSGIFAQRYEASGARAGSEFQANTYIGGDQKTVSVAVRDSGDFILVWEGPGDGSDYGVFAQRFLGTGAPAGAEFQVNTTIVNRQYDPAVAVDPDSNGAGNFVVVWSSRNQDGSQLGVFGQRYSGSGAPDGPEFPVNTYTPNSQLSPAVAMLPDGSFVVTWYSFEQEPGISSGDIYAQRYASNGAPLGPEFHVNTYVTGSQFEPQVAADGKGRFVIVWSDYRLQSASQTDVFGQAFDSGGAPLGRDFQLNTFTPDYQVNPDISAGDGDQFTVVWGSFRQDPPGIASGIFGRRFSMTTKSFTGPTVPDLSCNASGPGDATASFVGGGADCTFLRAAFIPASGGPTSPPGPAPACFPYGLLDFSTTDCAPGSQLDFTITYPAALPAGSLPYKYGHPDPSNPNIPAQWYQFQGAVLNGNTLTFSITDGGVGDDDLMANGKIVDPGGPGIPSAESLSAALGLWAGLPLLAAAWLLARRMRS